jgi:hypothetical protein
MSRTCTSSLSSQETSGAESVVSKVQKSALSRKGTTVLVSEVRIISHHGVVVLFICIFLVILELLVRFS